MSVSAGSLRAGTDLNTLTDFGVYYDVLERLDFDPPCEAFGGCDKAAEWIGTSLCCGQIVLGCTWHKLEQQQFISAWLAQRCAVVHIACGGDGSRVRWEPLRGGGGHCG